MSTTSSRAGTDHAPLIPLLGTMASLLSTSPAFGVARLVFQGGAGSHLLDFESQGFLDGWPPVFFFAMTFALSGSLPPEEMGIVRGVAVLIDAFLVRLVRLVLLPVMLRLTGKAAGWSSAWLHKVLPTITFSHG